MKTKVAEEKPLVFIADDEEYEIRAHQAFEREGNEVIVSRDFQNFQLEDFLKAVHRDKTRHVVVLISMGTPWFNAILEYIKTAMPHRVMAYILIQTPFQAEVVSRKTSLRQAFNLDAYDVFDKTYDVLEDIVERVNYTPVWKRLDEIRQDNLTGLDNFLGFSHSVRIDLDMMRKTQHPWRSVLLLIDIDSFKEINDTLGHLMGDRAIKLVGEMLRTQVRRTGHPCRYHGDEFLVYLSGLGVKKAKGVKTRLQREANKLVLPGRGGAKLPLGLSIGIADVTCYEVAEDPLVTLGELIKTADEKMYEDKAKRKAIV